MNFQFSIDRGGTFTDIFASFTLPSGEKRRSNEFYSIFRAFSASCVLKLLSEDPSYADAPREGIRRILEREVILVRSGLVQTFIFRREFPTRPISHLTPPELSGFGARLISVILTVANC